MGKAKRAHRDESNWLMGTGICPLPILRFYASYAEDEGQVILHYSQDVKLVLVEILDFRRFMPGETVTALLAS